MKPLATRWQKYPSQISGTVYDPIDLSTLVATVFIDCKVLDFQMKAKVFHDLVGINPKYMSIDEIIWTLKTKFRSLNSQGLWITSKINKLDT